MSWVSQRRYHRLHTVAGIAYDYACILFPSDRTAVEKSEILVVAVHVDRGALRKGDPVTCRMLALQGATLKSHAQTA